MQSITINREDGLVYKDGEPRRVDCSSLPEDIRVIQWMHCPERKKTKAWIEFEQDPLEDFRPNQEITSLEPYQSVLDAWDQAPTMEQEAAREHADREIAELEAMLNSAKKKRESLD